MLLRRLHYELIRKMKVLFIIIIISNSSSSIYLFINLVQFVSFCNQIRGGIHPNKIN
jgi:hypothetical protein